MEKKTLQQTKHEVLQIFKNLAKDERYSAKTKENFFSFCKWEIYKIEYEKNLNSKNVEESYRIWTVPRRENFIKSIILDVVFSGRYKDSTIRKFLLCIDRIAVKSLRRIEEQQKRDKIEFENDLPF